MLRKSVLLILLLTGATIVHGQEEVSDEARIFYRNERTYSGSLLSNGWSLDYGQTKRLDAFRSFTYGGGIGILKHPKEYKSLSPYTGGWGRSYVFGKLNEVMMLRAGAGFQKEIFSKYDKGGIAIRYFYTGGLSLALLKPIYYLTIVRIDYTTGQIITDPSQFDPDLMQSIYDIYDRESFFYGIKETRLNPGAFIKAGISFEYSTVENKITALEGGVQADAFLNRVPIMAGDQDRRFMFALFVSYRFGKVIDRRN